MAQSESIPSILSADDQFISDITRSHAEIASEVKNDKVKMRPKRTYSPKRQAERKASFERKRKSFEARRMSSTGILVKAFCYCHLFSFKDLFNLLWDQLF